MSKDLIIDHDVWMNAPLAVRRELCGNLCNIQTIHAVSRKREFPRWSSKGLFTQDDGEPIRPRWTGRRWLRINVLM